MKAVGLDLFEKFPRLKALVKMRSFQFWVILPNLVFFYLFLLAGIWGTPVGNANVIIVFVWIFWWFLLIAIMVPFGSRVWCTMCPLPIFGEWFQRRRLIGVTKGNTAGSRNKMYGLNKKWPKKLSNIWLQNFGFLSLAIFSAALVTRPIVSFMVFAGMILASVALSMIYRQRAFCNYLCPISGFLSLYSMTATIAVRSKDTDVCVDCRDKGCVRGNEKGWGCPWYMYLGKMDRNNYCGLCMECVKTCSNDNVGLFLRPFASDNYIKSLDEAYKAFIMLVLAAFYSVTLLGRWGTVKDWANVSETGDIGGFAIYALSMVGSALVIFPGIYLGFAWISKKLTNGSGASLKDIYLRYSYVFVPFGLLAWIAFSIPLVFVNGAYILTVISDPLGWGWDLMGTANIHWNPFIPEYVPHMQAVVLGIGFWVSAKSGLKISNNLFSDSKIAFRGFFPVLVFLGLITFGFLKLFVG